MLWLSSTPGSMQLSFHKWKRGGPPHLGGPRPRVYREIMSLLRVKTSIRCIEHCLQSFHPRISRHDPQTSKRVKIGTWQAKAPKAAAPPANPLQLPLAPVSWLHWLHSIMANLFIIQFCVKNMSVDHDSTAFCILPGPARYMEIIYAGLIRHLCIERNGFPMVIPNYEWFWVW